MDYGVYTMDTGRLRISFSTNQSYFKNLDFNQTYLRFLLDFLTSVHLQRNVNWPLDKKIKNGWKYAEMKEYYMFVTSFLGTYLNF